MEDRIQKLLEERYLAKGEKTWGDIAKRVSGIYKPIYEHILNMEFLPSSPTMMNFCTSEGKGTLSSCFPMSINDNMESILESLKECGLVTRAGGGIGLNFGKLRSSKEIIKTFNGNSSGPLPFIKMFNTTLDGIRQSGKRRGAGMAQYPIYGRDILKFIRAKKDYKNNDYNRFNFSVRIPNWFYKKLEKSPNEIMKVKNVVNNDWFDLEDNGEKVTIKKLWDEIIDLAFISAEPGIFNEDIAFERCTVTNVNKEVLSNPCQEFISIPYAACSLGSINLSKLVEKDEFNYNKFKEIIRKATIFLDSTIDINNFPIEKIKDVNQKIRPIGLGYMGISHALYKLGISYSSKEGFEFIKKISTFLTLESMKQSVELAKKNKSYPAFNFKLYKSANKRFFKNGKNKELLEDIKKFGIRNSSQTSIAPTGSISYIANCSSGIEPIFSLSYIRRIEHENKKYEEVYISDPIFEEYLDEKYKDKKYEILRDISRNNGSCQNSKYLTKNEKEIFVTSKDISPIDHLKALENAANNISLSISKTINLPKEATKEEISKVYLESYKKGIIGVTVYREGSREGILINKKDSRPQDIKRIHAPKRPKNLLCDIHEISVNKERHIVLIGRLDDGSVYEIFVTNDPKNNIDPIRYKKGFIEKEKKGVYNLIVEDEDTKVVIKSIGKIFNETYATLSRLISMSLRHGTPLPFIVEQLEKVNNFFGFEKAVVKVLKKYIKDGERVLSSIICGNNDCKSKNLIYQEGCLKCADCGWSKC